MLASRSRSRPGQRQALFLIAGAMAAQVTSAATIAPAPTESVVPLYIGGGALRYMAAGNTMYGYTKPIPIYGSVIGVDAPTATPRMTTYKLGCADADTPTVTEAPNAECLALKEDGWTFAQAPGTFEEWGRTQVYERVPSGAAVYYDARQNCEIHFPTATAPVPENPTGICSGTVVYIYVNNSKTTTEGTRIATVTVTHIPDWSLPVTITGGLELLNAAATDAAITSGSGESKPTPSLQNAAERGSRGSRLAVALAGAVALFGGWLV